VARGSGGPGRCEKGTGMGVGQHGSGEHEKVAWRWDSMKGVG